MALRPIDLGWRASPVDLSSSPVHKEPMGDLPHIRLLLAVLLGAAFFCLSPLASARAHGPHGHGGHQRHGAAPEASVPREAGASAVLSTVTARPAFLAGLSAAEHHAARHHTACCAAGLGCSFCVSLPAEAALAIPAGRRGRPPAFSQAPPPSVVIEAPSKPPRTV